MRGLAFSPDGHRIISGSYDKSVRIWDARLGREIREFKGHTAPVQSLTLPAASAIPRDSKSGRIVSHATDGTVRIWDTSSRKPLFQMRGHESLLPVHLSNDASQVVLMDGAKTSIWDVQTGKLLPDAPRPPLAEARHVTPDGKFLVLPVGNDILMVGTHLEDDEIGRRLWMTRPDPHWHAQKRLEFLKENNVHAAALHRSWERQARGSWPAENGDFDGRRPTSSPAPLPSPQRRLRRR